MCVMLVSGQLCASHFHCSHSIQLFLTQLHEAMLTEFEGCQKCSCSRFHFVMFETCVKDGNLGLAEHVCLYVRSYRMMCWGESDLLACFYFLLPFFWFGFSGPGFNSSNDYC